MINSLPLWKQNKMKWLIYSLVLIKTLSDEQIFFSTLHSFFLTTCIFSPIPLSKRTWVTWPINSTTLISVVYFQKITTVLLQHSKFWLWKLVKHFFNIQWGFCLELPGIITVLVVIILPLHQIMAQVIGIYTFTFIGLCFLEQLLITRIWFWI